MTRDPLFLIAALACLAVVVILLIGIGGFAQGGAFNRIANLPATVGAIAAGALALFLLMRR